jgi:hypothetical protein
MKVSGKIVLIIFILSGASVSAASIVATDTSQASVQAAINRAPDGGTVIVPAGSSTWTSRVYISNKAITIFGAGIGQTIITSALPVDATNAPFYVSCPGKAVRISGFTCVAGPGDIKGFINITSQNFRVDNCAFTNVTKRGVAAYSTSNSWGVIDHCTFTPASRTAQAVSVFGDRDAAWNRPLSLGTIYAVYIEDCTFDARIPGDGNLDIYNGGRAVFRHNTSYNDTIGCHGLDSGGYRSALSWEVYDNTFYVTVPLPRQFLFRGGTGVVFNNRVTTSGSGRLSGASIELTCYRATGTVIFQNYVPWGFVTGSNRYDGNTDAHGWPALDQIGAAPPTIPPNLSDAPPAARSLQGKSPAYAWRNTLNGARMPMAASTYSGRPGYPDGTPGHPNVASVIRENRDFLNDVAKPGYTPYVYPHPLVTTAAPIPTPAATQCSLLQQRLDRLQRRKQRLQRHHRSNPKLNRRIRRVQQQLRLQHCL